MGLGCAHEVGRVRVPVPTTQLAPTGLLMLARIVGFACLGGFLYGYDLGSISGALSPIQDDLHTSEVATEVMVGAAKFGAIFGTFLGGALMLYYGRRLTIGLDSLFFILGPVVMALSAGSVGLTAGRALVGLGIGVSAVVVPTYLGEVAPPGMRGRIVEMYEVMLCLGMLSATLVDAALQHAPWNWRWMVGAPVVPAAFLALSLFVLPESPRWLVVNARLDEALAVIHRVYTHSKLPIGAQQSTAEVEQELMELWSSVEKDKEAARERALHALQASREGKSLAARRKWRFRHSSWQPLHDSKTAEHLTPSRSGEPSATQHGLTRDASNVAATREPLVAATTEERASSSDGVDVGLDRSSQQHLTESDEASRLLFDRQASGSVATFSGNSTQEDSRRHLRVTVRPRSKEGSPCGSPAAGSGEIQAALKDPTSPLYRSLSSIPSGLAPVRIISDINGSKLATPQSGLCAPRKESLQHRQHLNSHLSRMPLTLQASQSFWWVLWDMMADIKTVARGPEAPALWIALWLAFFNQAMASSAIINYAPQLFEDSGLHDHTLAVLLTSAITAAKILGVLLGVLLIDTLGRRPLLVWGSAACTVALLLLFGSVYARSVALEVASMCGFMLAFNCSYAGVFWVLLSELFSMTTKSPAASAATAMLFIAGFLADSLFLTLLKWLGGFSFMLFGAVAAAGGLYSYVKVPETKGRTLAEVQALIQSGSRPWQRAAPAPLERARIVTTSSHSETIRSTEMVFPDVTTDEHTGLTSEHNLRSDDASSPSS